MTGSRRISRCQFLGNAGRGLITRRITIECTTEVSLNQKHLLATVATAIVVALPAHSQSRAVYTASQAAEGFAQYQTNCASCHLPDLSGRNEAPQLAGGNFMNTWGPRTTTDLIRYIQSAMPPSNPGGLSEEICSNIVGLFSPGQRSNRPETARWRSLQRFASALWLMGRCPRISRQRWRKPPMQTRPCRAPPPRSRPHRLRRGPELSAGYRRDVATSRSCGLADCPGQLSGLEPQPSLPNHPAER